MTLEIIKNYFKIIFDSKKKIYSVFIIPLIIFAVGLFIDKTNNETALETISVIYTDKDQSDLSKDLLNYLEKNNFKVIEAKEEEISKKMASNSYVNALIIDKGFEKSLERKSLDKVKLISIKNVGVSNILKEALNSRLNLYSQIKKKTKSVTAKDVLAFEKNLDGNTLKTDFATIKGEKLYSSMDMGAGFGLYMIISGIVAISSIILSSKMNKTYARIKIAPIKPITFINSVSAVNFILVLAKILIFYLVAKFLFSVQYPHVAAFYMILMSISFIFIFNAYFIHAENFKSQDIVSNGLIIIAMISGSFWPISLNPEIVNRVAQFLPLYWANVGINQLRNGFDQTVFLKTTLILLAFILFSLMLLIYSYKKSEAYAEII